MILKLIISNAAIPIRSKTGFSFIKEDELDEKDKTGQMIQPKDQADQ